jgi:hypothetical protein
MGEEGMSAQEAMIVAGVVTIIVQVLKHSGLSGRWALLVCAVLSTVGVGLFGYSEGTLARETAFEFFAGWASVFSSAAGIFGIINKTSEQATSLKDAGTAIGHTVRNLTGTGNGKP